MRNPRFPPSKVILTVMTLFLCTYLQAQELSVSLTGSMHNGSGVPCFGKKEGTVTSSVSGGSAPYTYLWSNGATTGSISGVAAGYYSLVVRDALDAERKTEITLTEPEPLKITPTVSTFSNEHNISCFECSNGYIQLSVTQGTPPYTYAWADGSSTSANRYGLGPRSYSVTVTDANECIEKANMTLTQPERSDWTMSGNASTDPDVQYIGTSDNKDVVFKANGQESLRLKANGDISLLGSLTEEGPLFRMEDGTIRAAGGIGLYPVLPPERCRLLASFPYWETRGNSFPQLCPEETPVLGTRDNYALRIITNDQQRMVIGSDGKVGIGTNPTNSPDYRLFVENGIACRDVLVKLGAWPDFVFEPTYDLMPLDDLRAYLKANKHLPGIPSAAVVEANGGLEVGRMQTDLVKVAEEQALYILQLEERLGRLEQRLMAVEASQH